jgi:glycosyltransferase involved in cell wall biosynthesis
MSALPGSDLHVGGSNAADPLLSIVTVSLNAAATIEDTITSVALQSADFDIEHICVDGGSNDGTRQTIDRCAATSARLRRVYEPDSGIFDAMNNGLRAARGEYVLFLNADDFLASRGILATALRGVNPGAHSNPDLIAADVCMGRLGTRGFWRHRRVPRLLGRLPGLFPIHQGYLLKRRLLEQIGGFDTRLRLASDVTLYFDLERHFQPSIHRVNADLTFMRAGGAANAGLRAILLGSIEIYRHLVPLHGVARAAAMVTVKSLQSLLELRYGNCPHERWFCDSAALR